jgi:hypothetical protein
MYWSQTFESAVIAFRLELFCSSICSDNNICVRENQCPFEHFQLQKN